MNKFPARIFQGAALLSLAIFLFERWFFGTLGWYIHERFWWLIFFAIAALFLMGLFAVWAGWQQYFAQTQAHPHQHAQAGFSLGALLIVLLPLSLGWALPNRPLDSAAIGSKGINAGAPPLLQNGVTTFEAAPDQRNILDWLRLFSQPEDVAGSIGEQANVIGFVYHDPSLPENQFMVSRFVITCCAADGFAVGMVVAWPEAASLPEDGWVAVKGPVEVTQLGGRTLPLIRAESVEATEIPVNPYLFP